MNFNLLYKQFLSPLTRFVFKRIGSDPIMADQIVTETFTAAWKGYKTFKHKSSFFTWLCRIALNKIADEEKISVEDSEVEQLVTASGQEKPEEVKPQQKAMIKGVLKRRKALDRLLTLS